MPKNLPSFLPFWSDSGQFLWVGLSFLLLLVRVTSPFIDLSEVSQAYFRGTEVSLSQVASFFAFLSSCAVVT